MSKRKVYTAKSAAIMKKIKRKQSTHHVHGTCGPLLIVLLSPSAWGFQREAPRQQWWDPVTRGMWAFRLSDSDNNYLEIHRQVSISESLCLEPDIHKWKMIHSIISYVNLTHDVNMFQELNLPAA